MKTDKYKNAINDKKIITLIALFCLFSIGCSGVYYSKKDSETLSRGLFATKASLDSSRVDLAAKYVDEAIKVAVPPKKKIQVDPIVKKKIDSAGQTVIEKVVVLPETAPEGTIRVNSDEFKELLKDKQTLANYIKGEEVWRKYSEEVDKRIQENAENAIRKDKLIDQQNDQIKSLVKYRNIVFGFIAFIGIAVITYIVILFAKMGIFTAGVLK
jgi:hypothetical protein